MGSWASTQVSRLLTKMYRRWPLGADGTDLLMGLSLPNVSELVGGAFRRRSFVRHCKGFDF